MLVEGVGPNVEEESRQAKVDGASGAAHAAAHFRLGWRARWCRTKGEQGAAKRAASRTRSASARESGSRYFAFALPLPASRIRISDNQTCSPRREPPSAAAISHRRIFGSGGPCPLDRRSGRYGELVARHAGADGEHCPSRQSYSVSARAILGRSLALARTVDAARGSQRASLRPLQLREAPSGIASDAGPLLVRAIVLRRRARTSAAARRSHSRLLRQRRFTDGGRRRPRCHCTTTNMALAHWMATSRRRCPPLANVECLARRRLALH